MMHNRRKGPSALLAMAAVLFSVVKPSPVTAQEALPFQLNVTYRCSDIDTLVIHRREVNEKGEWYFFEVTRNTSSRHVDSVQSAELTA